MFSHIDFSIRTFLMYNLLVANHLRKAGVNYALKKTYKFQLPNNELSMTKSNIIKMTIAKIIQTIILGGTQH